MTSRHSVVERLVEWTAIEPTGLLETNPKDIVPIDRFAECARSIQTKNSRPLLLLMGIVLVGLFGYVSVGASATDFSGTPTVSYEGNSNTLNSMIAEPSSAAFSGTANHTEHEPFGPTISIGVVTDDGTSNVATRVGYLFNSMGVRNADGATDDHVEIRTTASVAEYTIVVEGTAKAGEHANTHEHEYQDSITCEEDACKIHGFVANGGLDDFFVGGEIVDIEADEPITIYLNGEELSNEVPFEDDGDDGSGSNLTEGEDEHRLEISTTTGLAEYRITVEGSATPGAHADTHEHTFQDTVECEGDTCALHGYVANGGLDDFIVNGTIVAAESDEPITAMLDGNELSLDDLSDELDVVHDGSLDRIGPAETIAVEPGTAVLLQVGSDDPDAITWESEAVPVHTWSDYMYLLEYGAQTGSATAIAEFDEEGTYEIRAIDADDNVVTWTVHVEHGGKSAPTIDEFVGDQPERQNAHSNEEFEFTAITSSSEDELAEILWFEGGMDTLVKTTAISDTEATTSVRFAAGSEFFEHSPLGMRVIDEQNLISEETWEWSPSATAP